MVINSQEQIIDEMAYFKEDLKIYDSEELGSSIDYSEKQAPLKIPLIHDGLVMGVKNYFQKLGFKKAILGLSGGIDSAVTLVIAAKALGSENGQAP